MPDRAAIYIRVSTVEQAREGYSLAAQERTLRAYCQAKGYEVYNIYADEGRSGKSIAGREAFQKLIKDGTQNKFTKIVIWKISRFARNLSDFMLVCNSMESKGIYLESVSEAFDSITPIGRMIRGVLAVVAQWEREVIAENVKAAMLERAMQGKRTCSYVLGYDKLGMDSLAINAREAEIVRRIYAWYIETHSLKHMPQAPP